MSLSLTLFESLFDGEALKSSSPKMTKFSDIPEERRKLILTPDDPQWYSRHGRALLNGPEARKYFAMIEPSRAKRVLSLAGLKAKEPYADVVVVEKTYNKESSRTTLIKLTSPNGWSAETAIGKSFGDIHLDVTTASGSLVMPKPELIVDRCIAATEGYERIGAISFRMSTDLDRHPDDYIPEEYGEDKPLYLRFERQGILGMPKLDAFVFTIQTHFVDLTDSELAKRVLAGLRISGNKSYARHLLVGDERGKKFIKTLEHYAGERL